MPLKGFPKSVTLRDGTVVTLRLLQAADETALLAFFRRLPAEDRQYLKDDVVHPDVIRSWCRSLDYARVIPVLAEREGEIVGDATLHRQPSGWMRHVGEIRVVTDPFLRRRGLASALAREIFYVALQVGLDKMVAEVVDGQTAVAKVFEKLGFRQEARLAGHILDLHGRKHDLIILTTDIPALMQRMEEMILQTAGSLDD